MEKLPYPFNQYVKMINWLVIITLIFFILIAGILGFYIGTMTTSSKEAQIPAASSAPTR